MSVRLYRNRNGGGWVVSKIALPSRFFSYSVSTRILSLFNFDVLPRHNLFGVF